MRKKRGIAVILIALCVALGACGDDSGSSPDSPPAGDSEDSGY